MSISISETIDAVRGPHLSQWHTALCCAMRLATGAGVASTCAAIPPTAEHYSSFQWALSRLATQATPSTTGRWVTVTGLFVEAS